MRKKYKKTRHQKLRTVVYKLNSGVCHKEKLPTKNTYQKIDKKAGGEQCISVNSCST